MCLNTDSFFIFFLTDLGLNGDFSSCCFCSFLLRVARLSDLDLGNLSLPAIFFGACGGIVYWNLDSIRMGIRTRGVIGRFVESSELSDLDGDCSCDMV